MVGALQRFLSKLLLLWFILDVSELCHSFILLLSSLFCCVIVKAPPTSACHGATVYDPRVQTCGTFQEYLLLCSCCVTDTDHVQRWLLCDFYIGCLPLNEEWSKTREDMRMLNTSDLIKNTLENILT